MGPFGVRGAVALLGLTAVGCLSQGAPGRASGEQAEAAPTTVCTLDAGLWTCPGQNGYPECGSEVTVDTPCANDGGCMVCSEGVISECSCQPPILASEDAGTRYWLCLSGNACVMP